ncbi:MAG TPA: metallopeptidase TldD-related protein [Anaerolineales bacterium]
MKERILQTLRDLRKYALDKGYEVTLFYHEEDSYLMRFANSSISLNTNEHLIRLDITAYSGRKRASYELITDLGKLDEMKQGIDIAAEMVQHAQPLTYQPTVPVFAKSFADESGYDAALAQISNEERLQIFNNAAAGLETEAVKLSGIFSCGTNTIAQINTRSEHTQYFKTSDAQVTTVLAHTTLKWEVTAEQSAHKKSDLDPSALRQDLAFLVEHYQTDAPQQIPLGSYDIVFGTAATADMLNFMNWIGFNGGSMKRGFSFLGEDKVGQKVFSDKITLVDDPNRLETFPFKSDFTGIVRKLFPIFQNGVFQGFTWFQDDADEFGAKATGHTVGHKSLVLNGGNQQDVNSLQDLVNLPRKKDILYIPFLHYMNIVNPSKGIITGSSRFGALLLKQDGSVTVPYNVRLTQSLLDIFGDKVAWLSRATVPYNTSQSYGARNPTAIIVPKFVRVNDLEISHSNSSY